MSIIFSNLNFNLIYFIISINIIIYLFCLFFPKFELGLLFSLYNPLCIHFRFYQFLTHIFFHSTESCIHILFNILIILIISKIIKKKINNYTFLSIYFFTSIISSYIQFFIRKIDIVIYNNFLNFLYFLFKKKNYNFLYHKKKLFLNKFIYSPMIGSSGAISGIIGSIYYYYPNKIIFFFIFINLILEFINPFSQTAYFSHIIGIISGYLLSIIIFKIFK